MALQWDNIYFTSAHFDMTIDNPIIYILPQWYSGTGNVGGISRYFAGIHYTGSGSTVTVMLNTDAYHFMVEARINVLLVSR